MKFQFNPPWYTLRRRDRPCDPKTQAKPGCIYIAAALHEFRYHRFWVIKAGGTNKDSAEHRLRAATAVLEDEYQNGWVPLAKFGLSIPVNNARQGEQRILANLTDKGLYSTFGEVFTDKDNRMKGANSKCISFTQCEKLLHAVASALATEQAILTEEQAPDNLPPPRLHYTEGDYHWGDTATKFLGGGGGSGGGGAGGGGGGDGGGKPSGSVGGPKLAKKTVKCSTSKFETEQLKERLETRKAEIESHIPARFLKKFRAVLASQQAAGEGNEDPGTSSIPATAPGSLPPTLGTKRKPDLPACVRRRCRTGPSAPPAAPPAAPPPPNPGLRPAPGANRNPKHKPTCGCFYCKQSRRKYGPLEGEEELYEREQLAEKAVEQAKVLELAEDLMTVAPEENEAPNDGAGPSNLRPDTGAGTSAAGDSRPSGHQTCCGCIGCTRHRLAHGPLPGEEALYGVQMAAKVVADDAKEAIFLATEGVVLPEEDPNESNSNADEDEDESEKPTTESEQGTIAQQPPTTLPASQRGPGYGRNRTHKPNCTCFYCKQSRKKYGPLPVEKKLFKQEQELESADDELAQNPALGSLIDSIAEEAVAHPEAEPEGVQLTEQQKQLKAKRRNIRHQLRCGCIVCRTSRLRDGALAGEEGMEHEDRKVKAEVEARKQEARRQKAAAATAQLAAEGTAPEAAAGQQTPPPVGGLKPTGGAAGGSQAGADEADPSQKPGTGKKCTKGARCPCRPCTRKRVKKGNYSHENMDMVESDRKLVENWDEQKEANRVKRQERNRASAAGISQPSPEHEDEIEDMEVDDVPGDEQQGAGSGQGGANGSGAGPSSTNQKTNCSIIARLPRTFAQGVNVAVPGFSQVFNLGRGNDKEIQHRWWFWVVIAFIAALFVVLSFFAWRGWAKWRSHKRLKKAEEEGKTASQRITAIKLPSMTSSPPTLPPMHPKSENKESGGLGRVSVELVDLETGRWKEGKERKEWVPRYGVDWREVERRTGGGYQRRGSEGRGERRGSLGGVGDIDG